MKVRFAGPAASQLAVILSELASKNQKAASGLSTRVTTVIERLGKFPYAFQIIDVRPGIRRVPLFPYPYLMFYRVLADEITVVAVVHGARNAPWENL